MVGSIICGVDESASALGAARVARGLSRKLGLRLVFVRVVEEASADENMDAIVERLERLTSGAGDVTRRAMAGRGRPPCRPSRRRRGRHQCEHDRRRLARPSLVAARQRLRRCFEARQLSSRRRPSGRRTQPDREANPPAGGNNGDVRLDRRVSNAGGIVSFGLGSHQT